MLPADLGKIRATCGSASGSHCQLCRQVTLSIAMHLTFIQSNPMVLLHALEQLASSQNLRWLTAPPLQQKVLFVLALL